MPKNPRPLIGINADFIAASKVSRPQMRLQAGYFDAIVAAGGLPLVLPPLGKEDELEAFLDRVDGFVLSGGLDLDPRRQGLPMHSSVQLMAERRDASDRLLVRLLLERQMPVLGIGLGMQQLNVATGGSLVVHIPEEFPKAMPHLDTANSGPHRHLVLVEPNTRLDEIYGCVELRVNSHHHQAVKAVGAPFRVAAKAPDGIIEAIEAVDPNWFCIGVQWHPESESASALDGQLFDCFVQATIRESASLALAA